MNSKRRKVSFIVMAVVMALSIQTMPILNGVGITNQVYGTSIMVTSEIVGTASAVQGDENVIVNVEVENTGSEIVRFNNATLELDSPKDISITGGTTGTVELAKGQKSSIAFYLDVNRYAATGTRTASLILKNSGTSIHENYALGSLRIYEKLAAPENGTGAYTAAVVDITHAIKPTSGFTSDSENIMTLEIVNNGNSVIKNAEMVLTLPDGLSVDNDSNSKSLGYMGIGAKREVSFPVSVNDNVADKNYAVSVELIGLNYANTAVNIKKTFYIPVKGDGSSDAIDNVEISNINIPNQVIEQEDFKLSFNVVNRNATTVKDLKISVDVPEGLLNKSRTAFVESSMAAGATKNYTVNLFTKDSVKENSYLIPISVKSADGADTSGSSIQYASVYVKSIAGDAKTPQLMVDQYSYGGTYVQAGDEFLLELGLYNTNAKQTLSNIKVTLTSEDGNFIPVGSSNSFYVDEIGKKGHYTKTIVMSAKPTAEQKTTALNVDMSYEDSSGNAITAKDIISIPISQEARLVVDDIVAPPELYAMMQTGVSVQFYNMGKTVLNNLRVTAEGDFDSPESTSYYVGNMEAGKSDTYDFSFIPRKSGGMEGKIIFTYEDAAGDEQIIERPFSFQVMEEMPIDDGEMPPEDPAAGGNAKWPWIAGGALVLLGGGGIILFKKLKKRKINREMEIDE